MHARLLGLVKKLQFTFILSFVPGAIQHYCCHGLTCTDILHDSDIPKINISFIVDIGTGRMTVPSQSEYYIWFFCGRSTGNEH